MGNQGSAWKTILEAMDSSEATVDLLASEMCVVNNEMKPKLMEMLFDANRLHADIQSFKLAYEISLTRGL